MKTKTLLSFLILSTVLAGSCKKDKTEPGTTQESEWKSGTVTSDMMSYFNSKAPSFNNFSLSSSAGGTVKNDSISIIIPADAFADASGNDYNGNISVSLKTVRSTTDMIYSGVTTTSGGELLKSYGMFKLEVYDSSSNPLKLRNGMTLSAEFPKFSDSAQVFKGTMRTGASNNTVEWDVWDSTSVKRNAMGAQAIVSGLDELFQWCNLDKYMNETPLTDITVTTPAGFTNTNTECFIKYTGENSCAYIPSSFALKAFSTQGGYYKVVVGREAKVMCFSKKEGKFYYQVKTIPAITANQSLSMDNMTEVSEAAFEAALNAF